MGVVLIINWSPFVPILCYEYNYVFKRLNSPSYETHARLCNTYRAIDRGFPTMKMPFRRQLESLYSV